MHSLVQNIPVYMIINNSNVMRKCSLKSTNKRQYKQDVTERK